ncbi:MAG: type II toxin-antitoxin system HicA family toxin [Planctomycetota bacterium]|nr:MAG: type II toxin-antitoxin system HicA family toxin [Planctomycetota bacterium]
MRLPRDVSGAALVAALSGFGYVLTRQKGSHVRLSTDAHGQHHITIPLHDPLRVGTLNAILKDVAEHAGLTRDEVAETLFG